MAKEIIIKKANGIITIDTVSHYKYYGVDVHNKQHGFISQRGFGGNEYVINMFHRITVGNHYCIKGCNLRNFIIDILSSHDTQVFEFDTWIELLVWAMDK